MASPPDHTLTSVEEAVCHALIGKYPVPDDALREQIVRPILNQLWHSSADDAPGDAQGVEDDVRNQVLALRRIDRDWAKRPEADLTLEMIHRVVFGGAGGDTRLRTSEFVPDFEGVPPTALADVSSRRAAIEALLRRVDTFKGAGPGAQAAYLAELVSRIIAAHVFGDGNGRVARMAAQYCLCRWGLDFIAMPKVRNAPGWKKALHAAMAGEMADLALYLAHLMTGKGVQDVEQLVSSGGGSANE